MKSRGGRIHCGDINVYYRVTAGGGSRPLILLHGNGGSHHSFDRVVTALANGRVCYAVDARGQGRTTRGKKKLTYRQLAEDLAAFVAALRLTKPDIIGYSDGGIVALEYAARTENVGRIVTLGANWDETGTDEEFNAYCARVLRQEKKWGFLPTVRRRAELIRLMTEKDSYSPWETLTRVHAPVLLMAGDADVIPSEHTQKVASHLPNAEVRIIAESGHSIMKDQTAAFLEAVTTFLQNSFANGAQ